MEDVATFAAGRAELDSAVNLMEKTLKFPVLAEDLPWYSPSLWTLHPNRWLAYLINSFLLSLSQRNPEGYYGVFIHSQLRWPSGFRYTDPVDEYAKAKSKSGAKAVGKLGVPKVPVKAKGEAVAPMTLGKGPAMKHGVKYIFPPKAAKAAAKAKVKVSWCSL